MMKPGRKKFQYDEGVAQLVLGMSQAGIPLQDIATYTKISASVIRRLYREEYEKGGIMANTKVAQTLFEKATKDKDTAALIFWCKTRMGWKENQKIDLVSSDKSMSPAKIDFSNKTQQELVELVRSAYGAAPHEAEHS